MACRKIKKKFKKYLLIYFVCQTATRSTGNFRPHA